jgi:hypothetical protein
MVYVSRSAGTSTFDTLACRPPFADDVVEPEIEKLTCIVSSVQVTFGVAGKFGHDVLDAFEVMLAEPPTANHSVTDPPVPTESRSPFNTSLMFPLIDSVLEGEKPPISTMLVKCDGSSMPTTVHVDDDAAPL